MLDGSQIEINYHEHQKALPSCLNFNAYICMKNIMVETLHNSCD